MTVVYGQEPKLGAKCLVLEKYPSGRVSEGFLEIFETRNKARGKRDNKAKSL